MTRDNESAAPVICVVGARPNYMKMAPIIRAFSALWPPLPTLLVHTGQHYDSAMNDRLFGDLDLPLRLGIGLHAGPAIVGEMGYGRAISLTAIGDTVNTASRLEGATKELTCELVVSDELLRLAGVRFEHWPAHLLEVRGRQGRLAVRAVSDAARIDVAAIEITAS